MWTRLETIVAVALMVGMVATAALQVAVRYALSSYLDIPWTEEFSRLLLVWVTFWGAVMLHRSDEHIAMPLLYNLLPVRLRLAVRVLGHLVVVGIMTLIAWYGWVAAGQMMAQQTITLTVPLLGVPVPVAVFAYSIPLGSVLMIGSTLFHVWRRLQGRETEFSAEAGA